MARMKKAGFDAEQMLYEIADQFGDSKEGWQQLAVEMVKAMTDTQAKEILGYIARNWDIETVYSASTKKSKVRKSDYAGAITGLQFVSGQIKLEAHDLNNIVGNVTVDMGEIPYKIVEDFIRELAENYDEIPSLYRFAETHFNRFNESTKKSKSPKGMAKSHLIYICPYCNHEEIDDGTLEYDEDDEDYARCPNCGGWMEASHYESGAWSTKKSKTLTFDLFKQTITDYIHQWESDFKQTITDSLPQFSEGDYTLDDYTFHDEGNGHYTFSYDGDVYELMNYEDPEYFRDGLERALEEAGFEWGENIDYDTYSDLGFYNHSEMKSTKKSKESDLGISFEASVNSLRKTNYAKCGNLNTIVKERK